MRRFWLEFTGTCALVAMLLVLLVLLALMMPVVCAMAVLLVLEWVAERDWLDQRLWVRLRERLMLWLWNAGGAWVAMALGARLLMCLQSLALFGRGPPER